MPPLGMHDIQRDRSQHSAADAAAMLLLSQRVGHCEAKYLEEQGQDMAMERSQGLENGFVNFAISSTASSLGAAGTVLKDAKLNQWLGDRFLIFAFNFQTVSH